MMNRPKVAILSFSEIKRDGRVLRQIEYLAPHYEVTALGYGAPAGTEWGAAFIAISQPSKLQRRLGKSLYLVAGRAHPAFYEAWYGREHEFRSAYAHLVALRPDIIHANDWEALPVAMQAAQQIGAKVIADLHEFAPAIRSESTYWRWFYQPLIQYFLRKYGKASTGAITVGELIAERYQQEYGFRPITVMNVPSYQHTVTYRPCHPDAIQLIHHGNAARGRDLEALIHTVALADARFQLHFMLVARHKGYVDELKALSEQEAPGRIFFHEPVASNAVIPQIAQYDLGFYLLPPVNFNHQAALPNKFFDFIHAGLGVCIGPSLEMAQLTEKYAFGVVAPSFEPVMVAQQLNALSADAINTMKQNALKATTYLNIDVEMKKLLALYQTIAQTEQPTGSIQDVAGV